MKHTEVKPYSINVCNIYLHSALKDNVFTTKIIGNMTIKFEEILGHIYLYRSQMDSLKVILELC